MSLKRRQKQKLRREGGRAMDRITFAANDGAARTWKVSIRDWKRAAKVAAAVIKVTR